MEIGVCALTEFGRSDSLFYLSSLGYSSKNTADDYLARLQRVGEGQEVAFPSAFLLSPQKEAYLAALRPLPLRKRLLISLRNEEMEFFSDIRKLIGAGWGIDFLVEQEIDWQDERRLALYRDHDVRLLYLQSRNHDSKKFVTSLPSEWRANSFAVFLPHGERDDVFFTADEILLYPLELPLLVMKPLITSVSWVGGAQFFARPTAENYGPHFLQMGSHELRPLRRWIVRAHGEGSWPHRILLALLFSFVTPLEALAWPIRKIYWYLQFKRRR